MHIQTKIVRIDLIHLMGRKVCVLERRAVRSLLEIMERGDDDDDPERCHKCK